MIQQANQSRQQLRRRLRDQGKCAKHTKDIAQMTSNAVLWQIINQNKERDEEGNPVEGDAVLMVPHEELKDVPTNFSLEVKQSPEGTIIKATTVPVKSCIVGIDGKGL